MKIKKVLVILLALMLAGSAQLSKTVVSAETIPEVYPMSLRVNTCPKCHSTVIYSGCQYKFSGGVYTYFAGQTCKGCKQTVSEGQRHLVYYDRDRYFFNCTCGYSWHIDGEEVISRHEVTSVN